MIGYKLFRVRKDGSLGPLFINRSQRIPIGQELQAEAHRTPGYAYRPGWHICREPYAPHLSERGRAWFRVRFRDYEKHPRPESQGGLWFTAQRMKVLNQVTP